MAAVRRFRKPRAENRRGLIRVVELRPQDISLPPDRGAEPTSAWGTNMKRLLILLILFLGVTAANSQVSPRPTPAQFGKRSLSDVRLRDVCILADEKTRTYYAVAATRAPDKPGFRNAGVQAYTSKNLVSWEGPIVIFQAPDDLWGDVAIKSVWAPELHAYKGKYYLFLTFDTDSKLAEQWRDWLPRVRRGSQVLVSDSPLGPFKPFQSRSTTPVDMMTLDGTLWVEDGLPYMVFAHEWVQLTDGTIEFVKLKDDLSETIGEPKRIFRGSDAPWARKSPEWGCWVTDGPYLYRSKSGKLFMIWSSFSNTGYTTGVAISDSGKLAGPWRQQAEPVFSADGGHAMIFKRFDGQLMMVLHSPNKQTERARLFEMEDTGETLRVKSTFPMAVK